MSVFTTHKEHETMNLGREFAKSQLKIGDVVAVYGELGTGKTRFIKGICDGLGVREHVGSPTFTIVNEYPFPDGKVFHFDFYRVNSTAEIREIGFEEYLTEDGVCVIEWADRAGGLLPERRIDVWMRFGAGESEREIRIDQSTEVFS